MVDLAPHWKWEDHPDIVLNDACANGQCEKCPNRVWFGKAAAVCGHPCGHLEVPDGR